MRCRFLKNNTGVAMVEAAIGMGLFLTLIFGILTAYRIGYVMTGTRNSISDAIRWGIVRDWTADAIEGRIASNLDVYGISCGSARTTNLDNEVSFYRVGNIPRGTTGTNVIWGDAGGQGDYTIGEAHIRIDIKALQLLGPVMGGTGVFETDVRTAMHHE